MFPILYPPENTKKPLVFWCFRGVYNGNIGLMALSLLWQHYYDNNWQILQNSITIFYILCWTLALFTERRLEITHKRAQFCCWIVISNFFRFPVNPVFTRSNEDLRQSLYISQHKSSLYFKYRRNYRRIIYEVYNELYTNYITSWCTVHWSYGFSYNAVTHLH